MLEKATGLKCPICGSTDIYWMCHYYVSLQCNDCKFEVYPENEFASEDEFINEWNSYVKVNELLKLQNNIETQNQLVSKKNTINALRREHSRLLRGSKNRKKPGVFTWLS